MVIIKTSGIRDYKSKNDKNLKLKYFRHKTLYWRHQCHPVDKLCNCCLDLDLPVLSDLLLFTSSHRSGTDVSLVTQSCSILFNTIIQFAQKFTFRKSQFSKLVWRPLGRVNRKDKPNSRTLNTVGWTGERTWGHFNQRHLAYRLCNNSFALFRKLVCFKAFRYSNLIITQNSKKRLIIYYWNIYCLKNIVEKCISNVTNRFVQYIQIPTRGRINTLQFRIEHTVQPTMLVTGNNSYVKIKLH